MGGNFAGNNFPGRGFPDSHLVLPLLRIQNVCHHYFLDLMLLFFLLFLNISENLHRIRRELNLFYDICNAIN